MAAPFSENIKFSFQQMKRTDLMKTVIAKSHNRDIDFHFVYFRNAWCVDALSRKKKNAKTNLLDGFSVYSLDPLPNQSNKYLI